MIETAAANSRADCDWVWDRESDWLGYSTCQFTFQFQHRGSSQRLRHCFVGNAMLIKVGPISQPISATTNLGDASHRTEEPTTFRIQYHL
jgi:hypothetical protein